MGEHLTHGWEPDLDAGDSLLRRFVLANADRGGQLAELIGGRQLCTDTFAAADPASPVVFDNAAVLLQPPEYVDIAATVRAIVAFYPPGRHFVLLSLVEAYPMPGGERSTVADARVLAAPIRLFVGDVDGHPVATAGARIGHGVIDVEWVSTLPAYRGRGIGAALTWMATLADPSLPAALIASDDGQPVYEAMGYVRVQRLTIWHRPPSR